MKRAVSSGVVSLVLFTLLSVSTLSLAQSQYPSRPIRLISPFAAGGAVDLHARMIGQRMQPLLGQTFIVEAKPGGSGIIATSEVIRSKPDGYTILLGATTNLIIAPVAVKGDPPYDVLKDLATIAIVGVQPTVIIANLDLPAKSLKELIALIKANPGKYNYGIGAGLSVNLLMMEMFKKQAGGLKLEAVPYKGANEVNTDLLAGRIQLAGITATGAMSLYKAGKIRMIAICSESRMSSAPDVPTAVESGLPDLVVLTFNAISVAAATPKPIIDRLGQALTKIMATDSYVQDIDKLGMELFPNSSPERATKFIADIATKWTPQLRELAALENP